MLFAILLSGVCIFNITLALFVFFKNYKNHINISFSIFVFSTAFWILSNYLSNQITEYNPSFLLNKLIFLFTSYMSFGVLYFALAFPRKVHLVSLKNIILLWIPILVSSILIFSNQVISGINFLKTGGTGVIFGWGIVYFAAQFVIYLIIALVLLAVKYKKALGHEKSQLQYLLWGIATTMLLGTISNLIIPLFFNIFWFSNYGPFLTLFIVITTTYAMMRHNLMDIRLVVARAVVYFLLILLIGIFYTFSSIILSSYLLGSGLGGNPLVVYSLLTLVVALSFERLRQNIEKITDKFFFKGRYDSNKLLSGLGNIMSTNIDLEPLSRQILQTLTSEMRISRGALVFFEKNTIYRISAIGNFPQNYSYAQLAPLLFQHMLVFDELPEGEFKQLLRTLNISVSVSLQVKEEEVGLLLLGEKSSGEIYSGEDLKVLEILSPEVAIAIQNAKSFDKIKRFNITLSEEVELATSELRGANEKLKKLDALKDDFVSIASHELRTPMAAIRNYAWMALHRSGMVLPDNMEKYLVRILMSTERLINLVNDMLNISRIESGRIEIKPESVDMISLCKDIIGEVYFSKSTVKNIKFTLLELPLPKAFADPEKLRQVLMNLIGNALKFSPNGGKITIGFFTDGKMVETYIKDEGPGIAKDDLGKLFQKFGRLDSTYVAAATTGGTGLGLYISRSLVEFMKGRIWCQSEGVGKGATFTFSLPVANQEVLKNAGQYSFKPKGEAKSLEPAAI